MMSLSTSTNVLDKVFETYGAVSPEQCAVMCIEAGFQVLDFNFCDQGRDGRPIAGNDWAKYFMGFKSVLRDIRTTVRQTHLHMYDPSDPSVKNHTWEMELLRRSVVGSGELKARWAVAHPLHCFRDNASQEEYIKANVDFWGPIVDQAYELKYGIAFENMIQQPTGEYVNFCNGKDLVALVEALGRPNVGICLDFGHSNISSRNQNSSIEHEIKVIGSRLVALHVNDNHGEHDEHLAPFYGNIDWNSMMDTLRGIGYNGDLTYEVHGFTGNVPLELRKTQLAHLADIGHYLIERFNSK